MGMGFLAKLFGPSEPKVWPVHVDDDNFAEEVRRSSLPVLLDIWGPSCAPCKQMEPTIFRLAKQYQGQ
jgi:thioredoxin 1